MTYFEQLNHAVNEVVAAAETVDTDSTEKNAKLAAFFALCAEAPCADDRALAQKQAQNYFKLPPSERADFDHEALLPEVQAIAATRTMLAYHKVTFDPSKPPVAAQWDAFSDRFQDLIIKA